MPGAQTGRRGVAWFGLVTTKSSDISGFARGGAAVVRFGGGVREVFPRGTEIG